MIEKSTVLRKNRAENSPFAEPISYLVLTTLCLLVIIKMTVVDIRSIQVAVHCEIDMEVFIMRIKKIITLISFASSTVLLPIYFITQNPDVGRVGFCTLLIGSLLQLSTALKQWRSEKETHKND